MMNIFGTKKATTVETALKGIEKVNNDISVLQQEEAKLNKQKAQLVCAKSVIEAALVIDENDKAAQKQKEKAKSKIAELDSAIKELAQKLQEAKEQRKEAQKTVDYAKGEVFKSEQIQILTKVATVKQLEEKLKTVHEKNNFYKVHNLVEWGKAYNFGTKDNGRNLVTAEQTQFAKQQLQSAQEVASKQAGEIVSKLLNQLEKELKDRGVELQK